VQKSELKKLGNTHFTAAATNVAAMAVDAEGAAEPQLIKDLIQTQVTVATRTLQSELKVLRSQLSLQTKAARGAPPAPQTKRNKETEPPSDVLGFPTSLKS
jgi:hypothetical protein